MDIVLASSSKRRIEIMNELFEGYRIQVADISEFVDSYSSNEELVKKLSYMKAKTVFDSNKDSLVLGFDTLVFHNGKVIGKPQNREECISMIDELSDNTHEVITGFTMIAKDYCESFSSRCLVHFTKIPYDEIVKYSLTDEPYDKAGGYAIQGYIGRYIDKIDGDYFTVVGFPKALVYNKVINYLKEKKWLSI